MTDIKEAIEALKRAEQLILKLHGERCYWQAKAEYAEGELKRRGEIMALINERAEVLQEVHRLALVIESAVRTADPGNYAGIVAVLRAVKKVVDEKDTKQ